jgi:hypothetical protein
MSVVQHTRGNVNNLPQEGLQGQLFITEDTAELYGGQGTSKPLLRFSPKRYSIGPKSYVLATGYGVQVVKVNNACSFIVPAGVEILSASIYFTADEIAMNTSCLVDLGISAGCGHNADYDTFYAPQFQVWADVEEARFFKTGIVANFNSAAHILELSALTTQQAVWINLSF